MSLLTFSQEGIENLWKHTVKIPLGRAREVLLLEIGLRSPSENASQY